ncbi:MAG: amidohydrolase family protein [Myxococcales bacterium]|nr:amidohydrolase family protein [Myxococcales bacterium]
MSDAPDVVDAHIHLWDPFRTPRASSPFVRALGRHPALMQRVVQRLSPPEALAFLGNPRFVLNRYMPTEHRARAGARLRDYVHVEAGYVALPPLGAARESRWLRTLRDGPRGVVGAADLTSRFLPQLLDAHQREHPGFRGVRDKLAFSEAPGVKSWAAAPARCERLAFRRGYALLGERGLSFDAFVYSPQLDELARLVEAHPETPVVLCHLGTPVALEGPFGGLGGTRAARHEVATRWRAGLQRLAASPHVRVKLSGMLMPVVGFGFHTRPAPPSASELYERLGPHLRFALETFGPERCMFGSNFPIDAVSTTYDALLEALERTMRDMALDPDAQRAVLADTARRFYRL